MVRESFVIPPLPKVLLSIKSLMKEDEPDIMAIAVLVKEDIALYTLFLSAANSPSHGLSQPVTSIENAIMVMGLERIYSMVQAMTVRNAFKDSGLKESFWTAATDVAGICSGLAHSFSGLDRNQAYSIGMLHNAGIAIMLNNHKTFKHFMKVHESLPSPQLCATERKEFGTDHYLQGALMAKHWNLSEEVVLTIRCQPIAEKILAGPKKMSENIRTYLSILMLAKSVSAEFKKYWLVLSEDKQTVLDTRLALDYLQVNHGDFEDAKEDMLDEYLVKKTVDK